MYEVYSIYKVNFVREDGKRKLYVQSYLFQGNNSNSFFPVPEGCQHHILFSLSLSLSLYIYIYIYIIIIIINILLLLTC